MPRLCRITTLVLLLVLLVACGPVTAANPSGGTAALPAAAEPDRAIIQDSFTIALPVPASANDKEAYHACLQRLQSLLRGKGWNVALAEVPLPDGQTSEDNAQELTDIVPKMAAAGKGPDAWWVSPDMAQRLRAQGLTQDMAAVMPTASSMLWNLCKGAFHNGADGAPVGVTTMTKRKPIGLMMSAMQLSAYGAPIASTDDLLTFLEKRTDASILSLGGMNELLTDAWAAQRGYYALADYGLPPFFYALVDDADSTPVPVEDIEGFNGFFQRWTALWLKGRLDNYQNDAREYSGILSVLRGSYAHELQQYLGLQGADVVALPLAGCTQLPPTDPPVCLYLLAVPTASRQAVVVAAFAQWTLLDRQGADLCNYGQPDVDYRVEGERVEYLNDGKPLSDADWNYDSKSSAFYRFKGALGGYSGMVRVEKGSAVNLEQALAACKVEVPPLWRVKALRKPLHSLHDIFDITTLPYMDALDQHTEDISYKVEMFNGVSERTADQVLQRLRDNRPKLDPVILDLKKRLKQLLDDPDGDPTQTAQP